MSGIFNSGIFNRGIFNMQAKWRRPHKVLTVGAEGRTVTVRKEQRTSIIGAEIWTINSRTRL